MTEEEQLCADGMISMAQLSAIQEIERNKRFSIHWELRTVLYLGILLFSSGIGILVYLNIDTIGHQAVLGLIACLCAGCFYYGYKHRMPYSNAEVRNPSPFFDYAVLLGCLLFGIFTGYLQFQFSVFGLHYGIAVLFPTLLYLFCAYFFDHKGILSLGITGLAAWCGFTVTPADILEQNDFSNENIIFTGIGLGMAIAGFSRFSDTRGLKSHFSFSYNNFAANMLFVSVLSALFTGLLVPLSILLLGLLCYYYIRYAIGQDSFWFLLLAVLYGYIGLTYIVFSYLLKNSDDAIITLGPMYFIGSCVGIILFAVNYKKILRRNQ